VNTKILTARVPSDLAAKVDRIAARHDRSPGWVVEQALAAWIADEEARHRLTLEALADVDAGRVVDDRSVRAWAESLDSDDPAPLPIPR